MIISGLACLITGLVPEGRPIPNLLNKKKFNVINNLCIYMQICVYVLFTNRSSVYPSQFLSDRKVFHISRNGSALFIHSRIIPDRNARCYRRHFFYHWSLWRSRSSAFSRCCKLEPELHWFRHSKPKMYLLTNLSL